MKTWEEVVKEIEEYVGDDLEREIYADREDEIGDYGLKTILESADRTGNEYRQAFEEYVWEHYESVEAIGFYEDDLIREIKKYLCGLDGNGAEGNEWEEAVEEFEYEIADWVVENVHWFYPSESLNREVEVNIMIDSGNWNYDCVCDSILNYCGYYNDECFDENGERNEKELEINPHSSLLWLAKKQGLENELRQAVRNYGKLGEIEDKYHDLKLKRREELEEPIRQWKERIKYIIDAEKFELASQKANELAELQKAIKISVEHIYEVLDEEMKAEIEDRNLKVESKFVKSCIAEWENLPNHMSTLTFCVKMDMLDFFRLKEEIRNRKEKKESTSGKNITISKHTMCGLYAPWTGGGSILDVQLEKDVEVPLDDICAVSFDGEKEYGYDVGEVYGLCKSAWYGSVEMDFAA